MPSFIEFIPTPEEDIEGFFQLVTVSPSDVVCDLGSGDGRLLFAAIDRGAGRAIGVEMDAALVRKAREMARSKGLENRLTFLQSDVLEADLSQATVVFCWLSARAARTLKPKFAAELRPGTRLVMEQFPIPGWKPDRTATRGAVRFFDETDFFLYTMPPENSI